MKLQWLSTRPHPHSSLEPTLMPTQAAPGEFSSCLEMTKMACLRQFPDVTVRGEPSKSKLEMSRSQVRVLPSSLHEYCAL